MEEIDWSKAPEGATHYIKGSIAPFEKREGDDWFCWTHWNNQWEIISSRGDARLSECSFKVIPRPSTAWNGTGLPPAGVVCLHKHNNTELMRVCAIDGKWAAVSSEFSKFWCPINELVPIRTPEQIAAELADKAIEEIASIICRDGAFDIDDPEVTESAVAVYDAGYRKQEQPE